MGAGRSRFAIQRHGLTMNWRMIVGSSACPVFKACEQASHLIRGVLVILLDGQFEGDSEDRSGFVELASGQENFSKFNAGNHPVGLRICTPAEMELSVRGASSGHKCLREAEAEKHVVGLLIDEF